jgi:hypothetical protein
LSDSSLLSKMSQSFLRDCGREGMRCRHSGAMSRGCKDL